MRLPFDIARCGETTANAACPLGERCKRRLDPGRGEYQTYTAFPGDDNCYGFIDAQQEQQP